jgi:acyl dehydratase
MTPDAPQIEDLRVGDVSTFRKTVGESDVYLFAGITGDLDPNHVDEEFCRGTSLGRRVAHGALLVGFMSAASTIAVQSFPGHLVSVGYDRIRFLQPVFIGDTIEVRYHITDLDAQRQRLAASVEIWNQDSQLVAVATHLQQLIDR